MIERDHPALWIRAQRRLLSISRSSFHHEPAGETDQDLGLTQLIDRQFLDTPFCGVRQMTWRLQNEGHGVNQKRIPAGDAAHAFDADPPKAQRQQAEKEPQDKMLGGLCVNRLGQVWCADIT